MVILLTNHHPQIHSVPFSVLLYALEASPLELYPNPGFLVLLVLGWEVLTKIEGAKRGRSGVSYPHSLSCPGSGGKVDAYLHKCSSL